MGTDPPTPIEKRGERLVLKLGSGDLAPEQVAAQVLSRVRDLAETRYGATIKRVVMTSLIVRKTSYDMHRDLVRWNELVYRCELAKRQLSTSRDVPFAMTEAYVHEGARRDLRFTIDAGWAEGVWAKFLERARKVIETGLARAGWTPASVDVVGLVGGSSQTLAFRRMISDMFDPDRVTIPHDAETAVAIGATLLTARHQNTTSPVRTLVA